ncbi:acetyl-CoA synthetase [Halarchaeum rubridurum]|uniref:acetate--CoA ligase n=1 Tax=Halarchaeum rubridurum TaxID=489911 RepID=A0A830FXZ6_9EURY|nr:acetate--CoA ligase [Halarchaeum rubridurum]MBP1954248.1 acetyl-CoA synthetase [Halarchaeum rubridurum]GGM58499.1 acetyl-coenzyme A synthetase [Halarchaeum rubridurum]
MNEGTSSTGRSSAASGTPIQPPASFVAGANVTDGSLRESFAERWPECWERAADFLDWSSPYDTVLDATDGYDWFAGGTLNASYNCVDRHVEAGRKSHAALKWEGRLGETRTYTYHDLYREVNALAAALRERGVEAGDVVTTYMPMLPELPVTMLACARIGAVHSVVFAGYSADALAMRLADTESAYLVTCDGYYRRGTAYDLKRKADNACLDVPQSVDRLIVDRLDDDRSYGDNYVGYAALLDEYRGETVEPVPRAASDPLFVIYTSGTTGRPKAVRHTTGGYLAQVAWTSHAVLDLGPGDTHLCSADVGWITGHSYVVYGPLALGATTVLYEGTSDYPERDHLWGIVERNAVDVFYAAPTVIRAFMKWGAEYPADHDLSSLRLLGTVGEPIDETTWRWYHENVGGGECPIVDTWWQTETGGILVSTLPGVDAMRPGAAGPPLPGIAADVVDPHGSPVEPGESGSLVLTRPWPGMALDLGESTGEDPTDWRYETGDAATVDAGGYVRLLGREGNTLNVAGRRLGTREVEAAIVAVDGVAEAAVVGAEDTRRDTVLYAYVTPQRDAGSEARLRERVRDAVADAIGGFAVPDVVLLTPDLPKTRSGKVLRRHLRQIANGEAVSDTGALRNPEIVGELESIVDGVSE